MRLYSWINARPLVAINLLFILLLTGLFIYQMFRPLDVLKDWEITIVNPKEYRVVDGKRYPAYNPGSTLLFTSKSDKVMNASGTTSRILICKPTVTQAEREIQLDILPATKPTGTSPIRENAIILPDITQYDGLPRICRLDINITYKNIVLWRNHAEHAQTEEFIVEDAKLSQEEALEQIKSLRKRISELEASQNLFVPQPSNPTQAAPQVPQAGQSQSPQAEEAPEESDKAFIPAVLDGTKEVIQNLLGGL